ncbi:MAG: reverse transcriptase domain-containing protein [Candidatus Thiodiazotropha sp.]
MSSLPVGLINTTDNFMAGKTRLFKSNWASITSDRWILRTICGYEIEIDKKPKQSYIPTPIEFNEKESSLIDIEIDKFLKSNIIEKVDNDADSDGEYISNIFLRYKSSGGIRIILNLKPFNRKYVKKIHFKMQTLTNAIDSMRKDCYFAIVDLKDAFYSVPIRRPDRKFFRFFWRGSKFQFTALIMGLGTSPRIFTKIMKPVFSKLREEGFISTTYIDDSCLQGETKQECQQNVWRTVHFMDSLGFTINPKKSVLNPTKVITFVGFILNSENMTIRITKEKADILRAMCIKILNSSKFTIREFAVLIGKMVASEPGVEYARIYFRGLEQEKTKQLRLNAGNFDAPMKLTSSNRSDIQWWIDNIHSAFKWVSHGPPQTVLYTDSSLAGWGAVNETSGVSTGGQWSASEKEHHINFLELSACFLGLKSLCSAVKDSHIRVNMDNTTSCSYISHFGGKKPKLNTLATEIWSWARQRNVWISSAFVQGIKNVEADELSRSFNDDIEWSLDDEVFEMIQTHFPDINIDLFASRLNFKLPQYVSFRADPKAIAIDAFSLQWSNFYGYVFAPFSLTGRILRKVQEDQADLLLIAPVWPTQQWFPTLLRLLSDTPYRLPPAQDILKLPHNPERLHPLKKMTLGVFPLSGKPWKNRAFQEQLPTSSWTHGEPPLRLSMQGISKSGFNFQVNGKFIHLSPLFHKQ